MAVSELTKSSTKSLSELTSSELREELTKRLQNQEALDNVKGLIEVLKPPKKTKNPRNKERSAVENTTEHKT